MSGNWMLRSPTCTGGGGSRRDGSDVWSSSCIELVVEFFREMEAAEDMRLKSLLVLESFFSFFSTFSSALSKLCVD